MDSKIKHMEDKLKNFDRFIEKKLQQSNKKILGTYEAHITAKTKRIIPKKFLVCKKILQNKEKGTSILVSLWIPDTPESRFEPYIGLTLSVGGQSIRIYFQSPEEFYEFYKAFTGFLEANMQSLTSACQQAIVEWWEFHHAYNRIKAQKVDLKLLTTTPHTTPQEELIEKGIDDEIDFF